MNNPTSSRHLMRLALISMFALALLVSACNLNQETPNNSEALLIQESTGEPTATSEPTETIPPYTPLATLTPSPTLRPPPTFEPPTATLPPTLTPSVTPTSTLDISVSIPGLRGAETPTPTSTEGCVLRKEWKLTYTVVRDDALEKIANSYNTSIDELMDANCLTNANVIVIGQVLHVPGESQPDIPYVCDEWEVLTPLNGTLAILGSGDLTFNWRGPRAAHNLIRIIRPDGGIVEIVVDLRQNETIVLERKLPAPGTYTWYVYPLDSNYVQIPCKEGGPWTFTKALSPTLTPTFASP